MGTQKTALQVDLLFDIDNSASMGDKQALLELAIPDLVSRLVNPNCLDASNSPVGSSANGKCPSGQTLEFTPVHDMHLGIVSSSLGPRGGDLCNANQMTNQELGGVGQPFTDGEPSISSHTDDQAHLLSRSAPSSFAGGTFPQNTETEAQSPVVGAQNFIDWFPASSASDPSATKGPQALSPSATPETSVSTLEADFANLVTGVHAYGCGIESQLESWYRFLIQPDPYGSIAPSVQTNGSVVSTLSASPGSWVGYDKVIIQQRHDFLRPNSLVAIIVLSDENDSEIDTRAFGGQAYRFMFSGSLAGSADGTGTIAAFDPPKGTSTCATNPADPACTSCAYCENGTTPAAVCNDPNCAAGANTYTSPVDWGNDANLRHAHMKQKYGLAPQYPIERYYIGLTSPRVPDRTTEYPPGFQFYQGGTAQPNAKGAYAPGDPTQLDCTNPLFAPPLADGSTSLPDGTDMSPAALCNTAHPTDALTSRGPGLVFFAHIGGVPHQLLQASPGVADPTTGTIPCAAGTAPADCPQKETLSQSDWVTILGSGAAMTGPSDGPSYDYTGIDPHMIESFQPRTANLPAGTASLAAAAPMPMGGGPDPISGREWVTNTSYKDSSGGIQAAHANLPVDLEYACIFPLVDPITGASTPRDCSDTTNFANQEACDCSPPAFGYSGEFATTANSPIPAVCGSCTTGTCAVPPSGSGYDLQYYAKAYPTIREIELVRLMGSQGVLSSICPIHASFVGGTNDPVFGYRPAVNAIVNRLSNGL